MCISQNLEVVLKMVLSQPVLQLYPTMSNANYCAVMYKGRESVCVHVSGSQIPETRRDKTDKKQNPHILLVSIPRFAADVELS